MKIARVFPRKTNASPTDNLAFFDIPGLFPPKVDEVHISVTFTWDIPRGEMLKREWERVAPVKIGGPALGEPGSFFTPGMFLKHGYVITSRGCPNNCWFCSVPKREGHEIRQLPIGDGWNILDDNLLACSEPHIRAVFSMLAQQKQKPEFTGGLEAARLKAWHAEELFKIKPKQIFFAYDTPDDAEPLKVSGEMLHKVGFKSHPSSHCLRAYVLCGYPGDTLEWAERRMQETLIYGFMPMAMLWRDEKGNKDKSWSKFQRIWARPQIIVSNIARGAHSRKA